jgi:hypothetical protein
MPDAQFAHLRSGAAHHPGMTASLDCFFEGKADLYEEMKALAG